MRTKLIIGNWKMNKDANETKAFFDKLNASTFNTRPNCLYGLAVPYTSIAITAVLKKPNMLLCSQNISEFEPGAHTGEISGQMLNAYGVTHAIVGHSERRKYNYESNRVVNSKAKACLKNNIAPIICVGESLSDYEANNSKNVIRQQVIESIDGIDPTKIIIAYEPVWAIGTGKSATAHYAQEICDYIRSLVAFETPIIYGGSVNLININELMLQNDIDGVLVGNASLDAETFINMIKAGD